MIEKVEGRKKELYLESFPPFLLLGLLKNYKLKPSKVKIVWFFNIFSSNSFGSQSQKKQLKNTSNISLLKHNFFLFNNFLWK